MLCNFSIFIEKQSKLIEYSLFSLPRSLSGIFDLILKLGGIGSFKYNSNIIFALGVATALLLNQNMDYAFKKIISIIME